MKELILPTLSTLALSLTCSSVFAVDGTITVNGVITDQTCTLQGDGGYATGSKDIVLPLGIVPKSWFTPTLPVPMRYGFTLQLTNAAGTGHCDVATSKAFKGIHLSTISPDDLDTEDKTLLVNQATGAGGVSKAHPIFLKMLTENSRPVDFSAAWGTQEKSLVRISADGETFVHYIVAVASKTGIVDAQNFTAKINYTLHYN
ncbi:fimbrial protein [Acinetobacter sp. NyZ410]|uniref:fimbrial protein n=1 Tax=Acinetobacter sp. NyZ410 TaxID=2929509 RepID=UPI001FBB335B|nr:fimbrial protein [Acinetobacter sp. NyZ410]UOH17280.1 type 1 fimbrial protein [Acinetobacter sp. NyZ410]